MRYVDLPSGARMPCVGLGTWKSDPGEVHDAIVEAVRVGYRHIDCAPIYGNESEVGAALAECLRNGYVTREELWITSKLWNNAHAPGDVESALESTLSDLGLDYLDLYLIHWPVALRGSVKFPETAEDMVSLAELPIEGTWHSLENMVDEERCRHIGVSNFSVKKLVSLVANANIPPAVNQIELHPYLQQPAMLQYCRGQRIHLTAYSPLGSRDRPETMKPRDEPNLFADPLIAEIAGREGITTAQVLLSWALQRGTSVIPKSVNSERLRENLASTEISLTDQDMRRIASLDQHRRYVTGSFWAIPGSPYTAANLWDE